jgi:hypothetical protein
MKALPQPISLKSLSTAVEDRPVKRGALAAFRILRAGLDQAKTVPGLLQRAATDVREAWEESSRPKA